MFTIAEVADLCGVGKPAVRFWIKSGELKAVDVAFKPGQNRRQPRITKEALAEFFKRRGIAVEGEENSRLPVVEELV